MNHQIFKLLNITEEEYKDWCKSNNLPSYKIATHQLFFEKIQSGLIVKDIKTGKLIEKRRK